MAHGTKLEDPKWNADADVNEHGKISIMDITAIAKEFGKTA